MKAKIGSRLLSQITLKDKPYEIWDTDLAGFVLKVRKDAPWTYFYSYYRPDVTPRSRTRIKLGRASESFTPTQARERARFYMGEVLCGRDPMVERDRAKSSTLENYLENFYFKSLEGKKSRDKTEARIKSCFKQFYELPLNAITPLVIERWKGERVRAGIKKGTVNRDIATLKSLLSKAVTWNLLEKHPLAALKLDRLDSKGVVRYLSPDEDTRLREALNAREDEIRAARARGNQFRRERGYDEYPDLNQTPFADHMKPMVLISLNTGIRRGELFHLRWEHVNFETKTLTVAGETAKSGNTRHVPLNREALSTLQAWARQQGNPRIGLVFSNEQGRPFGEVKSAWGALLVRAKIEGFRWHDMRHDFASKLVMNAVDLNSVRELLGHADIKMTLRYAHLAPHVKADAVARLDATRSVLSVVSG